MVDRRKFLSLAPAVAAAVGLSSSVQAESASYEVRETDLPRAKPTNDMVTARIPEYLIDRRLRDETLPPKVRYPRVRDMAIGERKYLAYYDLKLDNNGNCWLNSDEQTFEHRNEYISLIVDRKEDGFHVTLDPARTYRPQVSLPAERIATGGGVSETGEAGATFADAQRKLARTMHGIESPHPGRWVVSTYFFTEEWASELDSYHDIPIASVSLSELV